MLGAGFLATALWWAVDLTWEAPAACPPADVVRDEIEATATVEQRDTDDLRVHAVIEERAAARWVLTLETTVGQTAPERRVIEGESCDAVTRAGILVVSIRHRGQVPAAPPPVPPLGVPSPPPVPEEPERTEAPPPPLRSTTEAPAEHREIPPVRRRSEPRQPRPSAQLQGWLSAAGAAAYGVLPGWGGAVRLEAGLQGHRWRASAGLRGLPWRTFTNDAPPLSARFDLLVATASGCLLLHARPIVFPICGRFAAGGLRGRGRPPLPDPRTTWSPWVGLGAEVGVAWFVHPRVALQLAVEGLASLTRPQFVTGSPPTPVWRPGRGGVRGWLGVEIHLPFGSRKRRAG